MTSSTWAPVIRWLPATRSISYQVGIVLSLDYPDLVLYKVHMNQPRKSLDEVSMSALLRHARYAYGLSMRSALEGAGYDDIPKNGLYVLGGLAMDPELQPLGKLIDELRLSKQAAGQLVDSLVTRGYLRRDVDESDRRRLTVTLTDRGRAAAAILKSAGAEVDAELLARVGSAKVLAARQALYVLVDIGRKQQALLADRASASGTSDE